MSRRRGSIRARVSGGILTIGRWGASVVPGLPRLVLPPASARRAAFDRLVRNAGSAPPGTPPLPFPLDARPAIALRRADDPVVSIVITHWGEVGLVLRCLASIGAAGDVTPHEVIVVDDASPDPTVQETLRGIAGIRPVLLETNVGYLRATNAGAAVARADRIVLLNNDTQVTPGWLDSLVRRADATNGATVVGSRLLYPDGVLQEAGGIVWSDAGGWNYGRGQDPMASEYRYARPVDYASAACLLAPRRVPLFDERFAPAYYEDTDLCTDTWATGGSVWYEPASLVFHVEGASHGVDDTSGQKRHQVDNRRRFAEKWSGRLGRHLPPDGANVEVARDRRRLARIVVIDEKVPTPDGDSGSVRMFGLLRTLSELGHPVHFVTADRLYPSRHAAAVEALGVQVLESAAATRRFVDDLGATVDVCVVSRPLVAAAYQRKCRRSFPDAVLVYDMVDFHAVRDARLQALGAFQGPPRLARRTARIERRAILRSDAIIAVTEPERRHVADLAGDRPTFVVPNIHDARGRPGPPGDGRTSLLFVGGFLHLPNVDAARYIVDELAPALHEALPMMTIELVGADAPDDLVRAAPDNVSFLGWLPDLDDVHDRARAVIAPLRAGAGLKGKVGDAMTRGVPVIASTVAAEGFGAEDGVHLLVADTPTAFVDAVACLRTDDELWLSMATQAQALIEAQFSATAARASVAAMLRGLGVAPPPPLRGS